MLMRVFLFLLDTVFFVLVGAALMRGWMNTRRLRMTQQPGLFVMAVTDWIVKPLRKLLPRAWAQANTDWGSLVAALVLAVLYSAAWHALQSLSFGLGMHGLWAGLWAMPLLAFVFLLRTGLQLLMLLVLAQAVLSWTQPMSSAQAVLNRLLDPVLQPLRRVVPVLGGVDLSSLVLLVLLQVGLILLG